VIIPGAMMLMGLHSMTSPEILKIDLRSPIAQATEGQIHTGSCVSPKDGRIEIDSRSLFLNGKPILPVMGEFQYSRYPESEWRDELLKMKAGGIDTVATYVFWIHHEETEGRWNWTGRRDLRRFVVLCGTLGLRVAMRGGPWCHGEVRNGGFPDYIAKLPHTRADDPTYMAHVKELYRQISMQLKGLYWKDGGPVISFQVENEFGGKGEHLMSLKRLAEEVGIDVPFYVRTGWPHLQSQPPVGELLPLFGGYPNGFWDRNLIPVPDGYLKNFIPNLIRDDGAIIQDNIARPPSKLEEEEAAAYPFLCCEIGGGMPASYHRRIQVPSEDVEALALTKLASGNNLQGYYMYHGGGNPTDGLTTLNETQATGYWNDLPAQTYDFGAPLGEFGQVREHYHGLRELHLFIHDFGWQLARLPAVMPEARPTSVSDTECLAWSVRSDGLSGFLFVNNLRPGLKMAKHENVQFELKLRNLVVRVPEQPAPLPEKQSFVWPVHLNLGVATLRYATAQPICHVTVGKRTTYFFDSLGGTPEFRFEPGSFRATFYGNGIVESEKDTFRFETPGKQSRLLLQGSGSYEVAIVVLGSSQSRRVWKGLLAGKERVVISDRDLVFDGEQLRMIDDRLGGSVSIFPAPQSLHLNGMSLEVRDEGDFSTFIVPSHASKTPTVEIDKIANAGPSRHISNGKAGVAEQPADSDFLTAASWQIKLPREIMNETGWRLVVPYVGDVARVYLGQTLIEDNFYNGVSMELGLDRFSPQIHEGKLVLKILPLRDDAPVMIAHDPRPFGTGELGTVRLGDVHLVRSTKRSLR
jgi:hypothetical protein